MVGEISLEEEDMPDTSCRQCGGELDAVKKCFDCREPIQWNCSKCKEPTEIRFHSQCMYGKETLCHTVAALA
ncbi:MAG: hypothetical protein HKO48_04580 [Nitrosopumilus sp.]|nr:hypothetical protein [Nitrosopumilus sp.]